MKSSEKTLFLFTRSFPFGVAELNFLQNELIYLKKKFDVIYIIPAYIEGPKCADIEGTIVIDEFARKKLNKFSYLLKCVQYAAFSFTAWLESFKNFILYKNFKPFKNTFIYCGEALYFKRWFTGFLNSGKINLHDTIFYTYWFNQITLGLALFKMSKPAIHIASRAHGLDLYEERSSFSFIPFRALALKYIDKIFLISQHGVNYLKDKYPQYEKKYSLRKLGIINNKYRTPSAEDNIIRIATCSAVYGLKRLPLLLEGLRFLTQNHDIKIEWHHIGDGKEMRLLEEAVENSQSDKLNVILHGNLNNNEVFELYGKVPFNIFMNVSTTEGVPVSIMEAQSCGIPAIAVSVGGIPEIVNSENGAFLSPNPAAEEIAETIFQFIASREAYLRKAELSRLNWETNFNAALNYPNFANELAELLEK